MFEERQGFEHNPPRRGTGIIQCIPDHLVNHVEFFVVEGVYRDFVHERGGGSPVFVGECFVDACFDVILWFRLVDSVVRLGVERASETDRC